MIEYIRTLVSQDKMRYIDHDFNLDLTYITPRIVAMSFPSCGFESTYRNDINQVTRFIQQRHGDHYLIMNLSSRQYDTSKFNHQVWSCEWNDHQAPTLLTIFQGIGVMIDYLEKDINNTVFLHCNAGKGRTGTMICAYLVYVNGFSNTLDARHYYSSKRFDSFGRGVTQPSQIRYIGYFAQFCQHFRTSQTPPQIRGKYLHKVLLKGFLGDAIGKDTIKPVLRVFRVDGNQKIYENKWLPGQKAFRKGEEEFSIVLDQKLFTLGDILVEVLHSGPMSSSQLLRVNVNTLFIQDNVMKMFKNQIDPDKFQDKMTNFVLELHFQDICTCWEYPPFDDNPLIVCQACSEHAPQINQMKTDLAEMKAIACKYKGDAYTTKELLFGNPGNDDIDSFLNNSESQLGEQEEEQNLQTE